MAGVAQLMCAYWTWPCVNLLWQSVDREVWLTTPCFRNCIEQDAIQATSFRKRPRKHTSVATSNQLIEPRLVLC